MSRILSGFRSRFKNTPTIPLLRLTGPIQSRPGGRPFSDKNINTKIVDKLLSCVRVKNLKAIGLLINSPGGSPSEADLIYRQLRKYATKHQVPMFSYIEHVAASGGYYLACAGDKIYANETAVVGSIGVITSGFGFDQLIEKWGIQRRLYRKGKNKAMLDPFLPVESEDVQIMDEIQEEIYQHFIDHVKKCRGERLDFEKIPKEEIFSGRIWTGKGGKKIGLVDEIGDLELITKKEYGTVDLVEIQSVRGFWDVFFDIGTSFGAGFANSMIQSTQSIFPPSPYV